MDLLKQIRQVANQVGELMIDEVRGHIELGAALLERNEFAGAIHELSQALKIRPDHARALYLLGLCYFRRNQTGDLVRAKEQLTLSVKQHSEFAEPYLYLGKITHQYGETKEALSFLQKGLILASDSALRRQFQHTLGSIFEKEGMDQKALRELRKAADSSQDAETLKLLVVVFLRYMTKNPKAKQDPWFVKELKTKLIQAVQKNPMDGPLWLALGRLLQWLAEFNESERALISALQVNAYDLDTLYTYCELLLQQGKIQAALEVAEKAYDLAAKQQVQEQNSWRFLGLLGRCQALLGQATEALSTYNKAIAYFDELTDPTKQAETQLMLDALRCAVTVGEEETAQKWAQHEAVVAQPFALAIKARSKALSLPQAQTLLKQVSDLDLSDIERAEKSISEAVLLRQAGHEQEAVAALKNVVALSAQDPRPVILLESFYQQKYAELPSELNALLDRTRLYFEETALYQDQVQTLDRIRNRYNAPFTVVVMGEFNAGKSTLLNAIFGEEIFPMGITPTTGIISVLTYGTEKSARLFYQDGQQVAVDWQDRVKILRDLDEEVALKVKWLQMTYPSELLRQLYLVDTPGFNSLLFEHETIARNFVSQADAILWVFAAEQAGKATEKSTLKMITDSGVKSILCVLNKVDRIEQLNPVKNESLSPKSDSKTLDFLRNRDEQAEIEGANDKKPGAYGMYVWAHGTEGDGWAHGTEGDGASFEERATEQFGRTVGDVKSLFSGIDSLMAHLKDPRHGWENLFLDVIPVSGKQALAAKKTGDRNLLKASNLETLQAALQHYFFEQKNQIKKEIAIREFSSLLSELLKQESTKNLSFPDEVLRGNSEDQEKNAIQFKKITDEMVAKERKQLISEVTRLHETLALEILEFARPRSWLFGENQATLADRSFMEQRAEEGLLSLVQHSQKRLEQSLVFLTPDLKKQLWYQVYQPYVIFAKGYLQGGWLENFFVKVLPKMDLTEFAVVRMLDREFPSGLEIMEPMLFLPLQNFILNQVKKELSQKRGQPFVELFERRVNEIFLVRPLQVFLQKLSAV